MRLRVVLRAPLTPILAWAGIAGFAAFVYAPWATGVLLGLFAIAFLTGVALRRRKGHSVKCSVFGAFGGVLDKSMLGF